ncbi:VF_A0006 family four-cysteine protein [Photobacterium sp. MCCC 1A19761]|uniref:VF_A0006 family four-cysteine protein n=1 Tax=Photobacterium sp. MCCC 1A19761 TaxID=3115000 RepID=UPI00307D6B04
MRRIGVVWLVVVLLTAVLLSGFVAVGNVAAKEDKAAYQHCVLTHVAGVEDSLAASLMTYACHRLYIDNFMLSAQDEGYFQCLLTYLPEAKQQQVTLLVRQTCHEQHRRLFR